MGGTRLLLPILDLQAWDSSKFLRIVRDQNQALRYSDRGTQEIIRADTGSERG